MPRQSLVHDIVTKQFFSCRNFFCNKNIFLTARLKKNLCQEKIMGQAKNCFVTLSRVIFLASEKKIECGNSRNFDTFSRFTYRKPRSIQRARFKIGFFIKVSIMKINQVRRRLNSQSYHFVARGCCRNCIVVHGSLAHFQFLGSKECIYTYFSRRCGGSLAFNYDTIGVRI